MNDDRNLKVIHETRKRFIKLLLAGILVTVLSFFFIKLFILPGLILIIYSIIQLVLLGKIEKEYKDSLNAFNEFYNNEYNQEKPYQDNYYNSDEIIVEAREIDITEDEK